MQNETISIIIPVYNVKNYLDRCVESVLRQSYAELEVILVDDGSTDGSSQLCDRWAEKDSRIRVIHKENGGVSDARNAGLDAATGEYLGFVDSDDYLAPDMYQKLYRTLKENDAEVSICNFLFVDDKGVPLAEERNLGFPIHDEVISGIDVLQKMHTMKRGIFYVFSWNKLYRKHLFSDVRFPKGKLSEDSFIVHRILEKCERVACITEIGYYYVQRTGSYMHNRSCMSYLNEAEARFEHMRFYYDHGLFKAAGHAYCDAGFKLQEAYARCKTMPEYSAELNEAFQTYRRNAYFREYCTPKEKLQSTIISYSPRLYHLVFHNPIREQLKPAIRNHIARRRLKGTLPK